MECSKIDLFLLNTYTHHLEAIQDKKIFSLRVESLQFGVGS